MVKSFSIEPIAFCHTPFKQKFGVPHQAGLTPTMHSRIQLVEEYAKTGVLKGLDRCSHIWLLFLFDKNINEGWHPTVKPPRHNERLGVFASRSPHRPNFIGQSVVPLISANENGNDVHLIVASADLVDGTPIVDIKPYLPQADAIEDAQFDFDSLKKETIDKVLFSDEARQSALRYEKIIRREIITEIEEVLRADPRPRQFRDVSKRTFGFSLYELNIKWHVEEDHIAVVTKIEF